VYDANTQRDVIAECVTRWMESAGHSQASMTQILASPVAVELADEDDINAEAMGQDNWQSGAPKGKNLKSQLVNHFTSFIRYAKGRRRSPHDFSEDHRTIFETYEAMLRERSAIDFTDFVPRVLELFRTRPEVLRDIQKRWTCLFVDEYQDVGKEQLELLVKLVGVSGSITVCGDDDQSIYGWRGQPVQSFTLFHQLYAKRGMSAITLGQSYRMSGAIVQAVSSVIACNQHR
jgi:superfamily I DNA/RNA helicase